MKKNSLFFVIIFIVFFSSTILFAQYQNLKKAIVKKNESSVKKLIEEHNLDVNCQYEDNMTALHFAATSGNLKIVACLVKHGANLQAKNDNGETPLHLACYNYQFTIAKYLIYHGANVLTKNNKEIAPLDWVLKKNKPEKKACEKLHYQLQVNKIKDRKFFCSVNELFLTTIILYADSIISKSLRDSECHNEYLIYRGLTLLCGALFLYKKQVHKKITNIAFMQKLFTFFKNKNMIKLKECFLVIDKIINRLHKNKLKKAKKIIEKSFKEIPKFLFAKEIDLMNKKEVNNNGFIHLYTKKGNLEELALLLNHGANSNARGKYGNTPLHIAVDTYNAQAVALLIDTYNAHINIKNNNKQTPLDLLLSKIDTVNQQNASNYFEMVKQLIKKPQHKSNDQLIHLIGPALEYNCTECAKAIIEKIDKQKGYLLHHFAIEGTVDIVRFLIEKGKYSAHTQDKNKKKPLCLATMAGNLEIVKYLIETCKADKQVKENPYIDAAKRAHLSVIAYFDDKQLFLQPHEKKQYTKALIYILRKIDEKKNIQNKQNIEIINRLIKRFADITFDQLIHLLQLSEKNGTLKQIKPILDQWKQYKKGYKLFYYFIAEKKQNIVRFMVEQCNYDPNKTNSYGENALHVAAKHGFLDLVAFFIESEMDIDEPDKSLKTPFMWACIGGNRPTVKYLNQQGAYLQAQDKKGYTPLHWACYKGNLTTIRYLIETCRVSLDPKDNNLFTPLHVACFQKNLPVIKLLVDSGANLYEKTNTDQRPIKMFPQIKEFPSFQAYKNFREQIIFGWEQDLLYSIKQEELDVNHTYKKRKTPLQIAIEGWGEKIATILIKRGNADINKKDEDGNIPVHTLLKSKNMSNEAIKLFAQKGANFYAPNNNGETPLDVALPEKRIFVTKELLFNTFTKDTGRISPRFFNSVDKTDNTAKCNQCSQKFNESDKKEMFLRRCGHNICFDCIENIFSTGGYRCPFCNLPVEKIDEGKKKLCFF